MGDPNLRLAHVLIFFSVFIVRFFLFFFLSNFIGVKSRMNCRYLLFVFFVIPEELANGCPGPCRDDGSPETEPATGSVVPCSGETEEFGVKWSPIVPINDRYNSMPSVTLTSLALRLLRGAGKIAEGYEFKELICVDKPVLGWDGKLLRVKLLAQKKSSGHIVECNAILLSHAHMPYSLVPNVYGDNECLSRGSMANMIIKFLKAL